MAITIVQNDQLPYRRPLDPFKVNMPTPPPKKKQERKLEKRGHGHDGRSDSCVNTFRLINEPGAAAFAALFVR